MGARSDGPIGVVGKAKQWELPIVGVGQGNEDGSTRVISAWFELLIPQWKQMKWEKNTKKPEKIELAIDRIHKTCNQPIGNAILKK